MCIRDSPLYDAETEAHEAAYKKLQAAALKELNSRTCEGMDAVLYRAADFLSASLRHLSLARSAVHTRTLRVLCAKLQCLEGLDLSHCTFARAADLRPPGNEWSPAGVSVYYQDREEIGETLTKSLGLLTRLRQLSLKGVPGVCTLVPSSSDCSCTPGLYQLLLWWPIYLCASTKWC